MTRPGAALLALSAALALAFGVAGPWAAAHLAPAAVAAMKASGIVTLALLAWLYRARLLAGGLMFGAAGDALLALQTPGSFLAGAGAFLIGHLIYIALFLRAGIGMRATLASPVRVAAVVAVAAAAVAGAWALLAPDDPLSAPLAVYTGVLTAMAMASFTLPVSAWPAMAGAVLFFVSDGFVAYDLFHDSTNLLRFAGWMIYWAGQAGICVGVLGLRRA